MRNKVLPLGGLLVVVVASLAGGYYERARSARTQVKDSAVSVELTEGYDESLTVVRENYAGEADLEILGKASIQGMLRQLDPHSAFFTREEFDELQTEQRSRIFGIGVTIVKRYDRVYVISAIPGTPAHRAGLRYGDAIVAIDGRNVEDWSSEQVMRRVRGERGEPVEITVDRAGTPDRITVRIRRDEVKLPSVRVAFMITGQPGTGFIALSNFSSKTVEELTAAIKRLKAEGMRQLILDMRGNPGGLLEQAVEVAQRFLLPGQKVLEVRGREERLNRTFEVSENNEPETMPLVILMNRYAASASEVVAGALQDHDRALIVGENSFGKGLVQSVTRVWGGAGLTLTTARYYTPTGRSLQRSYSNVSSYDYYLNRKTKEASGDPARGDAFHTDLGRPVYGGGGITPHIEAKSPESGPVRSRLFYGIFDFVRQLVAGQVQGLREYRVAETVHRAKVSNEDMERFAVTDKVIAAFRQHITVKKQFSVTDDQFNPNLDYVRTIMRREIITAAYGPEAGEQVYLPDDIQVRKALDALPEAKLLVEDARRARADRQQ